MDLFKVVYWQGVKALFIHHFLFLSMNLFYVKIIIKLIIFSFN